MYQILLTLTSLILNLVFLFILIYLVRRLMVLSKDVAHSSHHYATQLPDLPHSEMQTSLHPTTQNPILWLARIILIILYGVLLLTVFFATIFSTISLYSSHPNIPTQIGLVIQIMSCFWYLISFLYVTRHIIKKRQQPTFLTHTILMPYFVIPVSFVLIFLGITLDTTYQKYLTPTPATELDSQTELNVGNNGLDDSQISPLTREGIIDELTSATQRAHDTRYKMLRNTLMMEAEIYYTIYNMTYKGFCNSPRTLEHIMTQAEPAGDVICFDDNQNYAIAIKLTSGEYYCIDSNARESQSTTPPSSSMCQE